MTQPILNTSSRSGASDIGSPKSSFPRRPAVNVSLQWKLFGTSAILIAFVVILVCSSIDYLAGRYYMRLVEEYSVSPLGVHQMFLTALHRYVDVAGACAIVVAIAVSFFLTRRLLTPIHQMVDFATQVASGHYETRLEVSSRDEISRLGVALNRMAEKLQRIEQVRRTLMSDVAHELRTPLTNIRVQVEALNDGIVNPSKTTFESLLDEILRLVRLVEDISRLARAEAAAATLRLKPASLTDLVQQILEGFSARFAEKGIAVEADLPIQAGWVRGDSDKIAQALANLFQNAYQYTPEGGKVTVTTECERQSTKLKVTNTSAPISAKDLPFIFERFYRSDESRLNYPGGTGLGLSIVRELIEAHGGEVGASSRSGVTQVWFTLPTLADGKHTASATRQSNRVR
ncbi:MAG: ATP-binding protein [Acidobacteriota bacterium]